MSAPCSMSAPLYHSCNVVAPSQRTPLWTCLLSEQADKTVQLLCMHLGLLVKVWKSCKARGRLRTMKNLPYGCNHEAAFVSAKNSVSLQPSQPDQSLRNSPVLEIHSTAV